MMETVYKLTIKLEARDEEDLVTALDDISNRVEEGTLITTRTYIDESTADGVVIYEKDRQCEECGGEGEVRTDERDADGNIERGVGTQKCGLCQKK